MGIAESTLKVVSSKAIIRPELDSKLPHLTVECAKYEDGVGFIVTNVDIAKNSTVTMFKVTTSYSSSDNSLDFVCSDESVFTFVRDKNSARVFCVLKLSRSPSTVVRKCLEKYEALENDEIDKIGQLFQVT